MIYDKDIVDGMSFVGPNGITINELQSKLSFVAIKNGKHNGTGYIFSDTPLNLPKKIKLTEVYKLIKKLTMADAGVA